MLRLSFLAPLSTAFLLTLALPPAPSALAAVVAFAPLAFHLRRLPPDRSGTRAAAAAGALVGVVHAVLLLHWLPAAAHPLLGTAGALGAAVAAWGVHGALAAAATALAHRASRWRAIPLPPALAAAWVLLGWLPTRIPVAGFPWLGPEAALVGRPELLGAAGLIGGDGVAGLLVLAGASLGVALARRDRVGVVGLAATLALGGSLALATGGPVRGEGEPLRLALLSVSADPALLADGRARETVLPERLLRLDEEVPAAAVDLVVWPESPTGSSNAAIERELARERVAARGVPVLFGALAGPGDGATPASGTRRRNRVWLALPDAGDRVVHEKRRLVPAAEWRLPWEEGGFAPGAERPPFELGGRVRVPLGPGAASRVPAPSVLAGALVCFEVLFPAEARRLRREGARMLVVASNEGWLAGRAGGVGDAARRQHLSAAILLAAETRLPVVRSAVGGPAGAWDAAARRSSGRSIVLPGAGEVLVVRVVPASRDLPLAVRGGADAMVAFGGLLLLVGVVGSSPLVRRRRPLSGAAGKAGKRERAHHVEGY